MGIRTRAHDEELLDMVRLRAAGMTPAQIATAHYRTPRYVTTATNRVLFADLEESGEPPATVARAYWPVKGRTSP